MVNKQKQQRQKQQQELQQRIANRQNVEFNDYNDDNGRHVTVMTKTQRRNSARRSTTEFINQTVNIYDISQQILHYR